MSDTQRVVVTGLGLVTGIGHDEETVWSNLLAGRTGLRRIERFDASANEVSIGAEVDLEPLDALQTGKLRKADPTVRCAVEAARQALDQAGRLIDEPQEIGSIWGSACGQTEALLEARRRFAEKGPRGPKPSTAPKIMSNATSAEVSLQFGLIGSNQVIVSACTSATNAIGQGFRTVHHGYADAVLCGGSDAFFEPFYYGAWNNLGVLSKIPDPERALRPFDAGRDGTLLGEGAGALVLESLASAKKRGARIRGELIGYGESSDASHITNPAVSGQVLAVRNAMRSAGVSPESIGYVNSHGTATITNDVTEALTIREALGPAADEAIVGASKSFFGHTLGASGAIESIVTLLALESGVVPPNLNLDEPDPECDVRLAGGEPMELPVEVALKNSFGFGGGNGVLVFRRFS